MTTATSEPNAPQAMRWNEDRRLFERYRLTREPAVRDAIVNRFLPLVRSIARRYEHTSEPLDDLVQVGSIGLLKAIERFDCDRGIAFSSYAVPTISGEIKRHFRDRTWSVKVPRAAQEALPQLARAEQELEGRLGRSPTAAELAATVGMSLEEVADARMAALVRTTDSLDRPVDEEPGARRSIDAFRVEERGFAAVEDAATLASLLSHLELRDREVLRLRFKEDLLQQEIADRVGCSQMHVSRIIRSATERLASIAMQQASAGTRG